MLSSAVAKEIGKNISRLKGFEPTADFVEHIMQKRLYANIADTQYTDDSKVTDHYAIIPTGQLTELSGLTSLQRAVFELIVRRFLSIFYPPAEYENVKLVVDVDKESFFASSKVLKSEGYLQVANPPKKKSFEESNARILGKNTETADSTDENSTANGSNDEIVVNPKVMLELADKLKAGDEIACQGYNIKFGKTSPPKRYTSGSMVLAMENAGQLIEDEELRAQIKGSGIGTSATRGEILKKLFNNKYLALNKKTQIVTPTMLGEMIYDVVDHSIRPLLNPELTASWEKGLTYVADGDITSDEYMKKLDDFVSRRTLAVKGLNNQYQMRACYDKAAQFYKKPVRKTGKTKK